MAGKRVAQTPRRQRRTRSTHAAPPRRSRGLHVALVLALAPAAAIGFGVTRLADQPDAVTALAAAGPSASPVPARGLYPDATASAPALTTGTATPNPRGATRPTPARTRTTTTTTARKAVGLTAAAQQLTDLRYVSRSTSPAQTLDLYLPERTGAPVPLVIDIHGGAFVEGGKSEDRGRIDALLARGYAVASLNYRLTDEAPFPAGVKDVKAAVRWLRASSARYGIDPGAFAAWGNSAGGYFASMLGTTSRQRTSFDDPALGNAGVSSAVQAVVAFYAPTDFATMDAQAADPGGCPDPQVHAAADSPESRWLGEPLPSVPAMVKAASPLTYLRSTPAPPPFFLAHGTQDCNVPHGQSLELVAALRAKKVPQTLTLVDGAGHGGAQFDQLQSPVIAFLDKTLRHG